MSGRIAFAAALALLSFGGQATPANAMSQTVVIEGNTVVVASGISTGYVTFNGRQIVSWNSGTVALYGTFAASGRTFVVFSEGLGPSCAMFRIIAVSGAQATVSPQFGNCNETLHVSAAGGTLRVEVPGNPAHGTFAATPEQTHSFDGTTFH